MTVNGDAFRRPVIVAHNPVGEADDPSTSDVLEQVELVAGALAELEAPFTQVAVSGWRPWECVPRLAAARGALGPPRVAGRRPSQAGRCRDDRPSRSLPIVFNLVEAPPGRPQLQPATAGVFELLGLPFTGSCAAALWLTTDKLTTRAVLAAEGLPVAPGGRLDAANAEVLDRVPPPWILKPACEDASLGLEGNPLCATRPAALARAGELARRFPGQPLLAERYLPGRELNVSILAGPAAALPTALPIAEIVFTDFPEWMPRVVGYEAKWLPGSFAYQHTVRRFPDDPADQPLLDRVRRLALAAWRACGLAGYGRVDLRLDEAGEPHVLEVNANPCLSPGAGFMAAAERAGLTPRDVVARILAAALARHGRSTTAAEESAWPALRQPAAGAKVARPARRRAAAG